MNLLVTSILIGILPFFVVYWGIRNWTGSNSPLKKDVSDIQSRHIPDAGSSSGKDLEVTTLTPPPTNSPESTVKAKINVSDLGSDVLTTSVPQEITPIQTQSKHAVGDPGKKAVLDASLSTKSAASFINANKTMIAAAVGLTLLIFIAVLLHEKSNNEARLRAELEQKTAQLRDTEQRQKAAANQQERERADRAKIAAAAARQQQLQTVEMPANMPANFLTDFENYKRMGGAKAIAMALEQNGRGVRGAWSWAHSAATDEHAVNSAIDACEKNRRNAGISEACKIFAIGSDIKNKRFEMHYKQKSRHQYRNRSLYFLLRKI